MRLRFVASALIATAAAMAIPVAHAAMFKCTSPDGTVAFQAAPCPGAAKQESTEVRPGAGGATAPGRVQVAPDVQLRAVAEREETQRRDRCRETLAAWMCQGHDEQQLRKLAKGAWAVQPKGGK